MTIATMSTTMMIITRIIPILIEKMLMQMMKIAVLNAAKTHEPIMELMVITMITMMKYAVTITTRILLAVMMQIVVGQDCC